MMSVPRFRRLTSPEITLMRHLALHCGAGGQVMISRARRAASIELWRAGLVNIWLRNAPDTSPNLQGPYFGLSVAGMQLAYNFLPARGT